MRQLLSRLVDGSLFHEVMPDDSFNDVSELYSKIAISYIAMYNQADSTAILDESAGRGLEPWTGRGTPTPKHLLLTRTSGPRAGPA